MRILMVCLGNICRSPMAEGVLQAKADAKGLHWAIASVATERYHLGEAPHKMAQEICREHGIDISGHKSTLFWDDDLETYDHIFVMATDVLEKMKLLSGPWADMSKVDYFLNQLFPGENRDVPDPYFTEKREDFEHVYQLIDETCDRIIEKYA